MLQKCLERHHLEATLWSEEENIRTWGTLPCYLAQLGAKICQWLHFGTEILHLHLFIGFSKVLIRFFSQWFSLNVPWFWYFSFRWLWTIFPWCSSMCSSMCPLLFFISSSIQCVFCPMVFHMFLWCSSIYRWCSSIVWWSSSFLPICLSFLWGWMRYDEVLFRDTMRAYWIYYMYTGI